MNVIYTLSEYLATFIEGLTALFVASSLSVPKYNYKKHIPIIVFSSAIYTVLISLLNQWKSYSIVTLTFAIIYTFLILLFVSKGKLLLKITSSITAWFFIIAVDYVLTYTIIMIIGGSLDISKGFAIIMQPGKIRTIFILTDKILQAVIFILCRRFYKKLGTLNQRSQIMILIVSTFSYIVMQILMNLAISDSVLTLQIAIIFSIFFFVLTVTISIAAIVLSSEYQEKKSETELMLLSNSMLEKNYSEMKTAQGIISQQVHDFKNHLRILNGLIERDEKAKEYIDELVGEIYNNSNRCNCGNDTIDSIINCKMNEAEINKISFSYSIDINTAIKISSVDLCAILANQLDNAIEACLKIYDENKRFIKLKISQKESILLFKVTNSVNSDPFENNALLESTKGNSNQAHGYGIKNIKATAEKYSGILKNEYKDGMFTSSVMISKKHYNTQKYTI